MNAPSELDSSQPIKRPWLEAGLLLVVLLLGAVLMAPNEADADLWGHVQYGRDALRNGLPATTTFSYTAEGFRWINHENLAELLLSIGVDHVGPIGLLFAKTLIGLSVLALILRSTYRQGTGLVAASIVVLLIAMNLAPHWSIRPQLLSYFYLTLLCALLGWCFHGWQGKWRLPWFGERNAADLESNKVYSSARIRCLWLAPILFLFWANSHGGFVAGFCIFAAYLVFRSIEAIASNGRTAFGVVRRFAMMIAAAGLATLVNPYGPRLHFWLLESLTLPRPEITEWHAPDLTDPLFMPLILILAVGMLSLLLTRRSRDFTHLAILALTLWQSLDHRRHIPFFVVPFGFWMTIHLQSMLERFGSFASSREFGASLSRPARWTVAATVCLATVLLGTHLQGRLNDMPVRRDHYPVSAFQFMADHNLRGRLVVTYNWAQYAIAAFGVDGEMQVGFDGRFRTCYPQDVVDMHFDFLQGQDNRHRDPNTPGNDGSRILRFASPDLVLLNRYQPHSTDVMQRNRDQWTLLYQDKMAQLWGRADKYDAQDSPWFIAPEMRPISDEPQTGSVTWPALPRKNADRDWTPPLAPTL